MSDDEVKEVLSVSSEKDCAQKMPGSKPNVGHKRRRSATPMRPVAIAPKTNFPRGVQNVELSQALGIKSEPGFIAIVPRGNEMSVENDRGNKSIGKIDQYEVLESFTAGLQNAKRMKLGSEDVPMQYIILQNQSLENCNTILIADNEEKMLNQQKANVHEYTIIKNNVSSNGALQPCNVLDRSGLGNCSALSISPKINFNHRDEASTVQNSEKLQFNLHKKNSVEPTLCSSLSNSDINNESNLVISSNHLIQKSDSSTIAANDPLETLGALKSRPQKPVVIMQQLLSPPNRTSSVKTKRNSPPGSSKLLPINIQGVNPELKNLPEPASPQKSNESFYESKTTNHNVTRLNNDEQETDFLLKKEFPVISSSQVDSVLKAIDMQGLNRGIVLNEVINQTKKQAGDKDANDIRCSLPCVQGAAKFCKTENTQSAYTGSGSPAKLQTKRFQCEKRQENCFKGVEKLVDTLQCYKCKECSYISLNEQHIFEHIDREHINVSGSREKPVLKCPGCLNVFHHEASLLSHIVHDHQVHESEARIMVQQLSSRQKLTVDNHNRKPISQICITKTQNDEIFTQESDPLENNQPAQPLSTLIPSTIMAVDAVATNSRLENNVDVENRELQYIQNINNIPVIIGGNLEAVEVGNVPFLNDDKTLLKKTETQRNQQVKILEVKNVECSENVNLFELKTANERTFEFVNIKDVTHNDGEGYLQEDDTLDTGISDSEMELPSLPATDSTPVKIKKKGRPKGSKTYSSKPQSVSLKHGYKCEMEDCGVRMLVQENIVYHQKCHVGTTTPHHVSYQCPECVEFKSNNWNNLAGHLWRSHIIDMELYSCDLCSYKTPSLSHLKNQHRGIHGDDRPYLCDNCGKGFKTTKQLRNHRAMHRAKSNKPLQCDECMRDFTNTRLLKLHKDSVHRDSKPFTCSLCSYSASTRSALKLHLRRHTGEKPFACEQCPYSTGDHNSLRRHKLRHLGLKPYSCPHCSYACIQSSTYKVHLKNKHAGLNQDLMFSCKYCTYKSIKKENLLTHMAKHETAVHNKFPAGSGSPIFIG